MSNVATLNIAINASTGGVARGLDDTTRRITQFGRVGQAAGAGLRSMAVQIGSAVAAFASLRAIVDRFVNSAQRLDEVRKQAIRLETTTEALSGLQYAANLAGVDAAKLQVAMEKAADGIAEAVAEGGTAAEVFSRIGLDVAQLAQLSPDQQFLRIAEAIQQIGNQSERIRTVRDIFGRAGTELLPLFADGAQNIRDLTAEAQRFGDAVGGTAAAAAENMNDAFTRSWANVSRITDEITGRLAPSIQALVEGMGRVDASGQSFQGSLQLISDTMKGVGAMVVTVGGLISGIFQTVAGVIEAIIATALKGVAALVSLVSYVVPGLEETAAAFHAAADSMIQSSGEMIQSAATGFADALTGRTAERFLARTRQLEQEAAEKAANQAAAAGGGAGGGIDETARKISSRLATVGAFAQGTREAFSLSAEARRGQQAPIVDGLNRVVAVGRDQVAELKRVHEELRHGQQRLEPANI